MDHPGEKHAQSSHTAPVVLQKQDTFTVPQGQRSMDRRVEVETGAAHFSGGERGESSDEEQVRGPTPVDIEQGYNPLGAAVQMFIDQQDTRPVSGTGVSGDRERSLQSAFASSHGGGVHRGPSASGPAARPSTAPAAMRRFQPVPTDQGPHAPQPRASSAGQQVRQHGWWWWWVVENSSEARAARKRSNASRQTVELGDFELQAEAVVGRSRGSVGGVDDDVERGLRHAEPELSPIRDNGRPGTKTSDREVALKVEEEETRRCFLHVYFDWMRAICVVPDKSSPLRVMIWILLALISITQVLQELKREVLRGKGEGEAPLFYAAIGRVLIFLVVRAYFLYIVWRFGATIARLLGMLSTLLAMFAKRSLLEHNVMSISVLIMLASVLIAFAQRLVYMSSGYGWKPKDMLLFSSYDLARTLFQWRQGDDDKIDALTEEYGYNLNATTIAMALVNILWNVAGIIHQHFINDLGIMAAFTLRALAKEYCRLLDKTDGYTQAEYDELYLLFKCMRAFSELMDCIFGRLFNMLHVDKFTFCTFFVFHLVYSPEPALIVVEFLRFLYSVFTYYYVAADAATVNPRMRNWTLRNCPGVYTPFYENGVRVATATLLQETAVNPIAVGSGGSIIDWPFVGRFVGGVGNLFGFFAEHRGDA